MDASSYFAILATVCLFLILILIMIKSSTLFWIHGEDFIFGSNVHNIQPQIPQMKMMKVQIPFTFKVSENPSSHFHEVECFVSSQVSYRFIAYWGVNIRELHMALWTPWNSLEEAIKLGTLLDGHFQVEGLNQRSGCHGTKSIVLRLPQKTLTLGPPPRLSYPLVVILVTDSSSILQLDETVALINVIHIKDEVCTLSTGILAQYLKQASGQLSCLKQLYLAGGNSMKYDGDIDVVDGTEQVCVVCQHLPISRALLPCRHACICADCFTKLDTCPLCRCPIRSYFCIRSEEYIPESQKNRKPPNKVHLTQWFQDSLTDFLGFQR